MEKDEKLKRGMTEDEKAAQWCSPYGPRPSTVVEEGVEVATWIRRTVDEDNLKEAAEREDELFSLACDSEDSMFSGADVADLDDFVDSAFPPPKEEEVIGWSATPEEKAKMGWRERIERCGEMWRARGEEAKEIVRDLEENGFGEALLQAFLSRGQPVPPTVREA